MKQKKKRNSSDSDEDDTFYYRFASTSNPNPNTTSKPQSKSNGSGGLAPSKSTVYISNLDYSLTNSDLHTLFSTFGKLARVTVLKDRHTRRSRGVAFIQFVTRQDALSAAREMDQKILNGRKLSASIAEDNGRAPEFIKKRVYKDKSRCYECGVEGHLSYECPKNQLGPRERPVVKKVRGGGGGGGKRDGGDGDGEEEWGSDGGDGFEDENWASVVDGGADERLLRGGGGGGEEEVVDRKERKKRKKASYFSDESDDNEEE